MLTSSQKGTLLLIHSAITGKKNTLPDDFDISSHIDYYNKCHIASIIYYGALKCNIEKNSLFMKTMFESVYKYIILDESQTYEINKIYNAFTENEIDFMLLKGSVLKNLYPQRHMRVMSDCDILIKCDQYDKIRQLMLQLGYTEGIESDHEYIWSSNSLTVELHKHLIPSYNIDYYSYFKDGWNLAKNSSDNKYDHFLSSEDFFIYQFVHFAKHYRDSGIGIKHMIDLWVYKEKNPQLNKTYINAELKKLKLDEFYKNICNTLNVWFYGLPSDDKTDIITQVIFSSGAYGKLESNILSRTIRNTIYSGNIKADKRIRMFNLLFPSYNIMKNKYHVLNKLPILLPFLWIYRLIYAILKKNSKSKNLYDSIMNISDETVENYHDSLKYVGLDFNFNE